MRCVVTGGSGYIGRSVVARLLHYGHSVDIFDCQTPRKSENLREARFYEGDIRDQSTLINVFAGADAVFHLSGLLGTKELFENPEIAVDVNIKGALNVLVAADANNVPRVFLPTKPNRWDNVYSVTAQAVEKLGHTYRTAMHLDVRILRIFNVYGPGQSLFPVRKAIPYFILKSLEDRPLEIFGDGRQIVYPQYIEDVSAGIVDYMLLTRAPITTHELPAPQCISVASLAGKIIGMTKSNSQLIFLSQRQGETPDPLSEWPAPLHTPKATNSTALEAGLHKTIEWYSAQDPALLAAARTFYG